MWYTPRPGMEHNTFLMFNHNSGEEFRWAERRKPARKKERTEGGIRLCFKEQQRRRRRSKQDSVVAVHLHCMNEISIEKACQRGLVCLYMLDKSTSLINLIEHEALTAFCLINRHNGFAQRSAAK